MKCFLVYFLNYGGKITTFQKMWNKGEKTSNILNKTAFCTLILYFCFFSCCIFTSL